MADSDLAAEISLEKLWKDNRYRLVEEIGSGAFGVVFTAEDSKANSPSQKRKVIKFMKFGKDAIREAQLGPQIRASRDPLVAHVVLNYEYFMESEMLCIVMEYCDKTVDSLYEIGKKPLPVKAALDIFYQIVCGLKFIHSMGIVHRDLKPSNILMKMGTVKIADFGISKKIKPNEFTKTLIGTPLYMSPEVIQEKGHNFKTDIWSLGCILFELMTADYLFGANCTNMKQLLREIVQCKIIGSDLKTADPRLQELFKQIMQSEPSKRPSTEEILQQPCITDVAAEVKTILMIGRTGSGKSALANLLAGEAAFESSDSLESCTAENASFRIISEQLIVVDTVGTGDTHTPARVVKRRMINAIKTIRGGINAFLLCISLSERLSSFQPIEGYEMLKKSFPNFEKNGILVLTKAENLKNKTDDEVRQWIEKEKAGNKHLKDVCDSFSNRVVVIQNQDPEVFTDEASEILRQKSKARLLNAIRAMTDKRHEFEASRLPRSAIVDAPPVGGTVKQPVSKQESIADPRSQEEQIRALISQGKKLTQDKRCVLLKLQSTRIQIHELFCPRQSCAEWKKLFQSNQNDDLMSLLRRHLPSCKTCVRCSTCKLEIRIDELTEKEMDSLIKLHDEDVKKMALAFAPRQQQEEFNGGDNYGEFICEF